MQYDVSLQVLWNYTLFDEIKNDYHINYFTTLHYIGLLCITTAHAWLHTSNQYVYHINLHKSNPMWAFKSWNDTIKAGV